MNDNRIN